MSCYKPMAARDYGVHPNNPKKTHTIKFLGQPYSLELVSSMKLPEGQKIIAIPCGQCIGCRLDYAKRWADRCLAESLCHDSNYFLTLTYDDEHLPAKREGSPIHSLEPRELQLFMKRLRKKFSNQTIRFFACGEYGELNMRPHYHLILFGLKLDDLKLLRKSDLGQPYYISESISRLWTYGYHIIGDCTWNTCSYVARYMVKKQKGFNAKVYDELNYEPEFCRMSRRPGLGKEFYEERLDDFYNFSAVSVSTSSGSRSLRSNRYTDSIFLDCYGRDVLDEIKKNRSDVALSREIAKNLLTDTSDYITMYLDEERLSNKIKNLERSKKL